MDDRERTTLQNSVDEHTKSKQTPGLPLSAVAADSQTSLDQQNISYMSASPIDHSAGQVPVYDMRSMSRMLPDYTFQQQYPPSPIPSITSTPSIPQPYPYAYPMQPLPPQSIGTYPLLYHPQRIQPGYGPVPQQQYLVQPQGHYPSFPMQQTATYSSGSVAGYSGGEPHPRSPSAIRGESFGSSGSASPGLRGPPRKPRQSGHALWVGNLPPGTHILDLKDHFSQGATDDIESVFLISKSNCAFVNYRTEESCATAMNRFHESRFRNVRLVCRLRRGSTSLDTPMASSRGIDPSKPQDIPSPLSEQSAVQPAELTEAADNPETAKIERKIVKEKFFVVKSLTVEDLERSVQNGIWATQAHNEDTLNRAFTIAESVYLIFSANKSGEYFGYARMNSLIGDETIPEESNPPEPLLANPSARITDVPRIIPTTATLTAPKGYVIDDSARGTIFWEAESVASLTPQSSTEGETDDGSGDDASRPTGKTTFGKPFRVTWQSTERLPFYRARGLRNPWNANREVKIARDGTELEPNVGRKLLELFEQQAQINAAAQNVPPHQYGFPQMPPFPGPQTPYGYVAPGPGYGRPY